ncbi:MAG: hypothetical protein Q9187_001939 [Circinaria calcarea]
MEDTSKDGLNEAHDNLRVGTGPAEEAHRRSPIRPMTSLKEEHPWKALREPMRLAWKDEAGPSSGLVESSVGRTERAVINSHRPNQARTPEDFIGQINQQQTRKTLEEA